MWLKLTSPPTGACSGCRTLTRTRRLTGFWSSGTSSPSPPYFLAVEWHGPSSGTLLRWMFEWWFQNVQKGNISKQLWVEISFPCTQNSNLTWTKGGSSVSSLRHNGLPALSWSSAASLHSPYSPDYSSRRTRLCSGIPWSTCSTLLTRT